MGTGVEDSTMMDRKIPTGLWKTQILTLVNEAPRAVCINFEEEESEGIGIANPSNGNGNGHNKSDSSDTSDFNSNSMMRVRDEFTEKTESCSSVSSEGGKGDPSSASLSSAHAHSHVDAHAPLFLSNFNHLTLGTNEDKTPYGKAFHGYIPHSKTNELLKQDGNYLVRSSRDGKFLLSFRLNGAVKNFLLTYDDGNESFYLGYKDKPYRTLQELVQEGLTTMYLDQKAGSYINFMFDLTAFHGSSSSSSYTRQAAAASTKVNAKSSSSPSPTTMSSKSSMERLRNPNFQLHAFAVHTFESLSRCQMCQNFMWGLTSQGLQCKDCQFSIHEGCLDKVSSECCPNLNDTKEIFGLDLNFMVKVAGGKAPFVLEKCITEIEKKGLSTEGIYRVSGSRELIEKLRTMFEKDRDQTDLTQYADMHSLCGIVKRYLRLLPNPVITPEVFERFLNLNGPLTLEMTRHLIHKLPRGHQVTLKYILLHFHRIVQKSEFNRMTAFNLSSVFTPTLICPVEISLNNLKIGTSVLESMITFVPRLYPAEVQLHHHQQQQQRHSGNGINGSGSGSGNSIIV